jgi:hypothetical protein
VATFNVTITSNTTPAISITLSNNTTYQQFKNSLGSYVYLVEKIYLFSTLLQQIQGGFSYSRYDSSGKQNLQTILSTISPYQTQNSIFIDTTEKKVVIDGRDYVRFRMYPNNNLSVKLYCDRIANQDMLDQFHLNNFKDLERSSGSFGFFDQYVDIL